MGNKNSVTVVIHTPRVPVSLGEAQIVSAKLLLEAKTLLRIGEVAYILNISQNQVRKLADAGELERTDQTPVRITSASVKRYMREILGLDPADL